MRRCALTGVILLLAAGGGQAGVTVAEHRAAVDQARVDTDRTLLARFAAVGVVVGGQAPAACRCEVRLPLVVRGG